MKRHIIIGIVTCAFIIASVSLQARGSDGVAGALVGGLAAGMVAGSVAHSSGSSRAEHEAARAKDKVDQLQAQQERDKIEQLRREMEERNERESRDTWFYLILIMVFALFFGVGALALLFMKK